MKVKPLADRVVIKSLEVEETTKSGIVLSGKRKGKAADGGSSWQLARAANVDGKDVEMHVEGGRSCHLFQICGYRSQNRRRGSDHRPTERIFWRLWNKPLKQRKRRKIHHGKTVKYLVRKPAAPWKEA